MEIDDLPIEISNLLLLEIDAYYSANPDKLKIVEDIINRTNGRTCRDIETMILYTDNTYNQYQDQIKKYGKTLFDPFRRNNQLTYKNVNASIGQLTFFKRAFENEIIN